MPKRFLYLVMLVTLLAGCGGESGPTVMRLVGASPGLVEVTSWTLDGSRDGATTRATARLVLASGETMTLDLELSYDPTPVLAGGRWQVGDQGGSVTAEHIRFVGGQGEGPSVGGDYVLVDERMLPRFRVQLPLTPVARPAPRP
jgi:hypothetical protein